MERLGKQTEETGLRIEIPEASDQRFDKRTGVVLKRGSYLEGDLALLLFLKSSGATWCYVPGASKGSVRFGGALEPLVWGRYQLYRSKRRVYIREVEVNDDFWELRKHPKAVFMAVHMVKMLEKNLILGYPYDTLLILFYWALKALQKGIEPELVNARFLWRWLLDWGIAPDLQRCVSCGSPLEGQGSWLDGGFHCRSCSGSQKLLSFDEFADYALSASFIPPKINANMVEQARRLLPYFVKNLDENR